MVIGGLVGGLIGVVAARLYLRSAEELPGDEEKELKLRSMEPGDVIKLTLGVLGVLRLIDGLQKSGKG
jgi:hypothetical protein